MRTKLKMKVLLALTIVCFTTAEIAAQTQHGWRGPYRSGTYTETGILKQWAADGPQLLWQVDNLGAGYASPVIVGDRIFITGLNEDEDREIFRALTLTGEQVFEVEYGRAWTASYPGVRTTPTIVGDRAYVVSGNGEVVCINTTNGEIVWTVDGNTTFGRSAGTWGTSESPLVFDNKVIFAPGGNQTAIVALNATTGETVWQSRSLNQNSNYASPLLVTHNGKRQIIALTELSVIGVNPENGNIEWTFDDWGDPRRKIAPNTPLFKDERIFVSNGYNLNAFMLELNNDLTGVNLLWRNDVLDTHIGGFVLVDGVIYGSNWINNSSGNWVAVDWNTGETLFENEWSGGKSKGQIIAVDGMLIAYDERRGYVGLVRPSREKWDVVSEFRITAGDGQHWGHPVIDNGIMYIRRGNALIAYKIK
ncbi:MAG: PQQ-like beta-propeller repeat protein [Dysgonamonadaceae bacterium]|jgi:outer membrane protein assembly factor BamB|nr:PQQ-like beta-propeller repeat protein [Dysgonamonadaceae bacterium]